ncbi:hypothetical protein OCU04_004029 [Sclerotinia nivalis]|uniref:Uncharacterized protein n=1 Tax=Sclerotinia nivalis TaxID=352851 RepID=A0A9X0DNB6_9HELO|nr:hypothetical protein OCU04_004029 [Sclerotinia nivalis]
MSRPTVSHAASSLSASSRGELLFSHNSQSARSVSTVPRSFLSSTEKRDVSFSEPQRTQINHRDSSSEAENVSESDSENDWDEIAPHHSYEHRPISTRWTPNSTQDATIQLEFDCSVDIESHLEELSRLKRLGRFKDARRYFDSCRAYCGDHPDLIVDYVDTLLAQGAFKDVLDLVTNKDPPILAKDCDQIYHHYLHSALCLAKAITLGWLEDAVNEWRQARSQMVTELKRDFVKLSSLQIRFLCHFLYLETLYLRFINILNPNPEYESIWKLSWDELYTYLHFTNRVWDMRDIFCQVLKISSVETAIEKFFGTEMSLIKAIDNFVIQWRQEGDESTDLAIIDVLVTIALETILHRQPLQRAITQTINRCMYYARGIATSIRDNYPSSIKSSPYLRWILVEVRLEEEEPSRYSYFDASGGFLVKGNLPIYVPLASENPGWRIKPYSEHSNGLLHLGLNAARDLGHYGLEVSYLEQLVNGSEAPQIHLCDLATLLKNVLGDKLGYLSTCLTKYLLATERELQMDLSNELSEIDRRETPAGNSAYPTLRWFQRKIQMALCSSLGDSKEQFDLLSWMEKSAYNQMPGNNRDCYQQLHSPHNDNYSWGGNSIKEYVGECEIPRPSKLVSKTNDYVTRNAELDTKTDATKLSQRPRRVSGYLRSPNCEYYERHFPRRENGGAPKPNPPELLRSREMPVGGERMRFPFQEAASRIHWQDLPEDDLPVLVIDKRHEGIESTLPPKPRLSELSRERMNIAIEQSRERSPSPPPNEKRSEVQIAESGSSRGASAYRDKLKEAKEYANLCEVPSRPTRKTNDCLQAGCFDDKETNSGLEHSSKALQKDFEADEESRSGDQLEI